jgi:prepilin-type N-terminal cleavage/methylation domain-containing protein
MNRQNGFTIIELLIATLVFSMVLVLLSVGLIQISRVYYKGLTTSRTQQTARDITDNITRSIQFSGGSVTAVQGSGPYYFCVNNDRYTYQLNKQLTDSTTPTPSQANHVLIKDTVGACSGPASLTSLRGLTNATELMATNMRLSKLAFCTPGMTPTTDCPSPPANGSKLYSLTVRIVAGEDDLLDLSNPTQAKCVSAQTGTQFCAVAELQSTVGKRL